MGVFITSRSAATRHAVYAEERQPPASIQATGTGVVGLIGQFPWGPAGSVIQPTDDGDRGLTLAPPGMSRTGSGWLATLHKGWPDLRFVRVVGSAAVAAAVNLTQGGTPICSVPGKYVGAAGNSIQCVVSNADDGDATHFNLTVTVAGASGTTSDQYSNMNYSGAGTQSLPIQVGPRLAGPIVALANGRPDNGTYNMSGGSDGTINSARYTGTPGNGDFGVALFENDLEIRAVLSDDPGNTSRVAVNAALQAHAILMGDRLAVLNGDSGLSVSAVIAAAAVNRSGRVCWADCWTYIFDDTDGTERLVPPAPWLASVIARSSPSTSPAWKDSTRVEMLAGINRLETPRGQAAGSLTANGICTLNQEITGGFTFEAGVLTVAPADPTKKRITRTRIGDYIATSVTRSLRSSVDAPNVPLNQQNIVQAVVGFMETLKGNASTDPNNLPHVLDYAIGSLAAANPASDLANGDFTIPLNVKTSAGMERIFLSMQFGENVTITSS